MNAAWPPSCEKAMTELATEPPLTSRGSRAWKRSSNDLLLGQVDQPHRAALEAESGEIRVGHFEEDVDDGVAQAAKLKFFFRHVNPPDLSFSVHRFTPNAKRRIIM